MRGRVVAFAAVAVWSVAILAAQDGKVTNPEELDKTMKKVGPASQAMGKAAGSGAWADVRTALATMKQGVSDAENFWIINKREDAQKFTKDVLAKIDAAAKLVATDPVDAAAAVVAIKEIGGTCRQCHMVYRSQDANQNYIIKPGSIGGH
jgi:cytochrome c556